MTNKFCWITGASKGIGRATAIYFVKKGYSVIASSRTEKELISLKKYCDNYLPGKIIPLVLDVTNDSELNKAVHYIHNNFNTCEIIIFNAGTYVQESALKLTSENTKLMMDLNFNSIIKSIIFLKPYFDKLKTKQVIAISSIAGWRGMPLSAIYSASKSALKTAMESFALDYKNYGVKFRIVSPGFVDTPLTRKNKFYMPFLMNSEKAAEKIYKFITKSNKFETSFPFIFAIFMKLLTLMPWSVYRFLIKSKF